MTPELERLRAEVVALMWGLHREGRMTEANAVERVLVLIDRAAREGTA